MVRRGAVLATVLLLAAAACGDDSPTTTPGPTSTQPTPTTTTSIAPSTTGPTAASTTTTRPAATTTTAATAVVRLAADGLGVVTFGASKDDTVKALTGALGASTGTGKGCELAGRDVNTVSWKELTVQFVGGKFDAYTVRPTGAGPPSLNLRTPEGAGLGSTLGTLRTTYGSRLTVPGLPPEFGGKDFAISFPGTTRRLLGTVTATTDDAAVTSFFTQSCE